MKKQSSKKKQTNKFNFWEGLNKYDLPQELCCRHDRDKIEIITRGGGTETKRIMNIDWKTNHLKTSVIGWRFKSGAKIR